MTPSAPTHRDRATYRMALRDEQRKVTRQEWLSPKAAAEYVGFSRAQIWRWMEEN